MNYTPAPGCPVSLPLVHAVCCGKQLAHSGCCKSYQEIYSHRHADMVVYYMEIWFWNTTFTELLCLYELQHTKLSHKTLVMRFSFDSPLSKVSTPSEGCAVSPFHLCHALKGQCLRFDALPLATEQHLTCQLWCRSPHRKRFVSSISVGCRGVLPPASHLPEGRRWLGGRPSALLPPRQEKAGALTRALYVSML